MPTWMAQGEVLGIKHSMRRGSFELGTLPATTSLHCAKQFLYLNPRQSEARGTASLRSLHVPTSPSFLSLTPTVFIPGLVFTMILTHSLSM